MATFSFNFSPEQLSTPVASDFRDFPKVTNSGAYDVTIHQASLIDRVVKGEPRQSISLQLLATHLYLPEHKGRMYVNVDFPVNGKPERYDHLFYELAYLTGCVTKTPNGGAVLTLETQDVQPNYAGASPIKVFPALQNKRLVLVVRRSEGLDGRYWLNPVGFFTEQRLSLNEVLRGVSEPREIEMCSTTAEGLPLDNNRPSQSAPANNGTGFSAPNSNGFSAPNNNNYGGRSITNSGAYGARSAGGEWQSGSVQPPYAPQPRNAGFTQSQNGYANPNSTHLQPQMPNAPIVPQPVAMVTPGQTVGNNAMQRQFGPIPAAPAGNGGAMSAANVLSGAPVSGAPAQNASAGEDKIPF